MKRNRIFQSKQQLRGFSEGDFIDRGILLWVGAVKCEWNVERLESLRKTIWASVHVTLRPITCYSYVLMIKLDH